MTFCAESRKLSPTLLCTPRRQGLLGHQASDPCRASVHARRGDPVGWPGGMAGRGLARLTGDLLLSATPGSDRGAEYPVCEQNGASRRRSIIPRWPLSAPRGEPTRRRRRHSAAVPPPPRNGTSVSTPATQQREHAGAYVASGPLAVRLLTGSSPAHQLSIARAAAARSSPARRRRVLPPWALKRPRATAQVPASRASTAREYPPSTYEKTA